MPQLAGHMSQVQSNSMISMICDLRLAACDLFYENNALNDRSLWIRMIASANNGATLITRMRAPSHSAGSGMVFVTTVSTTIDPATIEIALPAKIPWVAHA